MFSYAVDPLVEKNIFRRATPSSDLLPPFETIKQMLPVPVLPDFPDWETLYWKSWEAIWRCGRLAKPQTQQIRPFIDSGYNNNVFLWDTAFMVQFAVYGRRAFDFASALDNFYAKQHADGFICREYDMESGEDYFYPFDPNGTGPNIMAWAEWRLFRRTGNTERLQQIFWPLMAYHRWCRRNRTWQNGLYWATGTSSGMDNQPRVPDSNLHHRHWSWVDACMQAAVNCSILEQMALLLEQKELAAELSAEKSLLNPLINDLLWSDEAGFYCDRDSNGRFSQVKTIGAFWGLQEKSVIPKKRLTQFVQHLYESWSFNVPFPIPAQSSDSIGYNAETGNYWRGAVWSTTNYMVLKGLRRAGQHKLAFDIAKRHLNQIAEVYNDTGTVWENYAPETAAPGTPAQPDFWGLNGVSTIGILLEDAIGVHVDWPQSRVYWDKRHDSEQPFGVRNYPVGPNGTMDLLGNNQKVTVTTDVPFTLVIRDAMLDMQTAVPRGTTVIDLI